MAEAIVWSRSGYDPERRPVHGERALTFVQRAVANRMAFRVVNAP